MATIDYLNTPDEKIIELLLQEVLQSMLKGCTFGEAICALPEDRPIWFDRKTIKTEFLERFEIL